MTEVSHPSSLVTAQAQLQNSPTEIEPDSSVKVDSPKRYSLFPSYYLLSLALVSGGGIFLEIALTRLFSTLFFPPAVFAIISVAVLGIGLGAALAAAQSGWRQLERLPLYLNLTGYAVLLLPVIIVWTVSLNLFGLLLALALLPFLLIGLALATLFSAVPSASSYLYRADLVGAGLGAVLAIPLMNLLGGLNSIFFVAGIFALAALIIVYPLARQPGRFSRNQTRALSLGLAGLAIIGVVTNKLPALNWLTIDMAALSSPKPITDSLAAGGHIIYTRWDAFARTDLVDPGQGKPYELYIDGAAGSVMPAAGDLNLLRTDIGFFPFATDQPEQVLVIGPGGGLDVWFGLNSRAKSITAVEINPASVAIVEEFAPYHDNLYGRPEVRVLIDEGRSLLRREDKAYDLIFLSQVVTLAAERSGYALTENTIYTVEAFIDYLKHLKPGGQIALKLYDELTLTRALVTAVTALKQSRALSEAEALAHVAVFLDPDAAPPIPLLMIQNEPFGREGASSYVGVASRVGFTSLFVPGVVQDSNLSPILSGEGTIADIIAASSSNISPTTDDRPFFYQFEQGLPDTLQRLLGGLGLVLLVGGYGLVLIQRPLAEPLARYAPLYFAALGFGFMLIEITLIQQTRLFLGHPTLTVTTILGVLLVGGGLGSGIAGRWPEASKPRRLIGLLIAIVILILAWRVVWPWLAQTFLAGPAAGRVAIASISVLPLALLLGIPFPLGLSLVGRLEQGDRHVALGWAVNGVMSVAGVAGAVAIAMMVGFNTVLVIGAVVYALAAIFIYWIKLR